MARSQAFYEGGGMVETLCSGRLSRVGRRRRSLNLISRSALKVPSCQTQGLCLAA